MPKLIVQGTKKIVYFFPLEDLAIEKLHNRSSKLDKRVKRVLNKLIIW